MWTGGSCTCQLPSKSLRCTTENYWTVPDAIFGLPPTVGMSILVPAYVWHCQEANVALEGKLSGR